MAKHRPQKTKTKTKLIIFPRGSIATKYRGSGPGTPGFPPMGHRVGLGLASSDPEFDVASYKSLSVIVAGLWPVLNIVFRYLGGSRPPDSPGWGVAAPQTPRKGFGAAAAPQPGGSGVRESPRERT